MTEPNCLSMESMPLNETLARMSHLSIQAGQTLNNLPTSPEQMLESAATMRQFHSQLMDARAHLTALYQKQRTERHTSSHPFFEETSP